VTLAGAGETFSMGRVASRTFSVLGRNALPFLGLALLAAAPQTVLGWYLVNSLLLGGRVDPAIVFTAANWTQTLGVQLIAIVVSFFLQAALVQATVVDLNGQPVSFGDALMTALRMLFPTVATALLMSLGLAAGFVLLVFPGLMLLSAWAVVVPVLIVERKGIVGSFGRSAELTKGYRWPIFGLMAIFYIAIAIINLAMRPVFGIALFTTNFSFPLPYFVFLAAYRAVLLAVSATGTASIYYELRSVKEGIGPQQLASVFE
jgi:hypothetical protein